MHLHRPPELKSLKNYFLTSGVLKNVFLCICAYFQITRIKSYKNYFVHLWSGRKRVLMHFQTNKIKSLKNNFLTSGVAKNVFLCICAYFQTTRIKILKKLFFNVWSGYKRVFMHLRILPDHQNQGLKKLFCSPLEWLKTCFDAFPDYQNQVLKK